MLVHLGFCHCLCDPGGRGIRGFLTGFQLLAELTPEFRGAVDGRLLRALAHHVL